MQYNKCYNCGDILNKTGLCSCETFYVDKQSSCPECGSYTFEYNDPSQDSTLGTYCTNRDCDYVSNQFMDWEDIKQYA